MAKVVVTLSNEEIHTFPNVSIDDITLVEGGTLVIRADEEVTGFGPSGWLEYRITEMS